MANNYISSLKKKIETTHEVYQNAPLEMYEKLLQFRNEYKITQFEFNGKKIEYLTTGKGKKIILMFYGALGSADTPYNEILRLKDRCQIIGYKSEFERVHDQFLAD